MRSSVSQLDQPSWNSQLCGDHGDGSSELPGLKRVDERVDEPDEGEREREPGCVGIGRWGGRDKKKGGEEVEGC